MSAGFADSGVFLAGARDWLTTFAEDWGVELLGLFGGVVVSAGEVFGEAFGETGV
jgi:hypothetical protein